METQVKPQANLRTDEELAVLAWLRVERPELVAAFQRHLPRARKAILDRLLQCVLRENIAGCGERAQYSQARKLLIVPLTTGGTLEAPVLRKFSLDRWDFGEPISVRFGQEAAEVPHAVALLDHLQDEIVGSHGENESWFHQFRRELDNSTANYALALAGFEQRSAELQDNAKSCGAAGTTDWAAIQFHADKKFNTLAFFEQLVVDGHPLHPGAKLKLGMSAADVVRYSPEWGACPQVRIVAVHTSVCRTTSLRSESAKDVLRREHPELADIVDAHLIQLDLRPDEHEWIPVHPWQFDTMLTKLYADDIADLKVVPVPAAIIPTAALMTVRSLAPLSGQGKHHLKTAINVQTTGAVRTVSAQAAQNGPMLAELLNEVRQREGDFDGTLVVLLEDVGVHYVPDKFVTDERKAIVQKNLSAILRESPDPYIHAGEVGMPASSLIAQSPLSRQPIVAELIDEFADVHGLQSSDAVLPFLRKYAELTIPGMLTLMTRYGIGLEGHLQNCVPVFREGLPVRMLVRDMGGVRILPERLAPHGLKVQFLPGSATLALDADDLRNKVGYAFLQNHWGELIACIVRHYGVDEMACWELVAAVCNKVFQLLAAAPESQENALADRAAFFRSRVPLKALTTMRLRGDVTKYSFSDVANPLANFVGL